MVSILTADSGVNAITTHVRPFADPQPTARPNLTYHRVSTVRPYSNDGPVGLATAHYQIDAWADTALVALQLADAVRAALDGFQGTAGGRRIDAIHVIDQQDGSEPVRPGEQKPVQRVTLDVTIQFQE